MNPDELRKIIDAKLAESSALIQQVKAGHRTGFSTEENEQYYALQAEIDRAEVLLKAVERQAEQEAHYREPAREAARPEVGASAATATLTRPTGFSGLGDYLQAVAKSSAPGAYVDPRLLNPQAAAGANEMVPSEGGYLVGTQQSNELLQITRETGLLVSRVRHIPIGAGFNSIKLPQINETSRADGSRFGGVQVFWTGEGEEKTASKPNFRGEALYLEKLTGLFYATDELLQDAVALESIARQAFASEFGFKLDDAIVRGTGAGMPMGILNSPARIAVAKESGQPAATIVAENIINMWSRLNAPSYNRAIWAVNPAILPQLMTMSIAVGVGGVPVWMPAGGLAGAPNMTLMGRPLIPVEQASALGTEGDIILFDPEEYIMIDKGGMQEASSIHVRFVYDETCFRWVLRTNGQPAWSTALTPANGSVTTSPFVTLATRA